MKIQNEDGFSLIELLIVVVIIGVIAALAIPGLRKSIQAAENTQAFSSMRTMSQAQANFYSSQKRYARLDELNTAQRNVFGETVGAEITRGKFRYVLTSDSSDVSLANTFTIVATRAISASDLPYVVSLDQSGTITQITP
jgi:prepilin-type N-terminal cleavage/methylation domain-containing protein